MSGLYIINITYGNFWNRQLSVGEESTDRTKTQLRIP